MKRTQIILLLIIISNLLFGCEINKSNETDAKIIDEITPTVLLTNTPVPSPTPTPTPLPITRMQNGELAFFIGDYEQAENEFDNIITNADEPDLIAAAKVFLSQIKMKENDCNGVISVLIEIKEDQSIDQEIRAKATFLLANCYNSLNQFSNAAESFMKLC